MPKKGPYTPSSDTIAVALKYDATDAPRVTARDKGKGGEEIIELARQYGIPIHEDPELVQLLAQIELGESIPEDLFVIVAEILAFAYLVSGKSPPLGPKPGSKE